MSKIARFGVSLEKELLKKFDLLIKERNYTNRSEAIRDLVRETLVKKEWLLKGKDIIGTIILVYDHHKHDLVDKLTSIQHDFQDIIISSQHIHLEHGNCLEIIVVKGKPREAQKLHDILRSAKGVKYGALSMATTGEGLV